MGVEAALQGVGTEVGGGQHSNGGGGGGAGGAVGGGEESAERVQCSKYAWLVVSVSIFSVTAGAGWRSATLC